MRRARGFTLIELMITMVVIAILAAIAVPSYSSHVRRGARTGAESFLMDVASHQQQYLVDVRAYADLPTLGMSTPDDLSARYTFRATPAADPASGAPTFTATATPIGPQLSDTCGALTIDQAGRKLPAGCW
jgi:type IV pilus assembly protein PilE